MAMEDSTEAAVSADANDKESDKVIEQFLTGGSDVSWRYCNSLSLPR